MFKNINIRTSLILAFCMMPVFATANTELSDPTRPARYIAENLEPVFFEEINVKEKIDWQLSAIRISNKDKTAILNNSLVRVGDDVGPAKVLEINPLSVVIEHEDKKLIVRLYNTVVMKDYKSRK